MKRIVVICFLILLLCFPVNRLRANSRVLITSQPSGASVTLDGNPIGQTPLPEISLPPGTYQLDFQREGYHAHSYSLKITADGLNQPVHVELSPLTGSLHVESNPSDANRLCG